MSDQTSCLHVPANSRFLRLYDFMIDICDGNECAAALLSFFASWHDSKLKQQRQARAANDVAARHGEPRSQGESLWQWHSEDEIEAGILVYKRGSFPKALSLLVKKGFITISSNPNKKYKFDRTRYFRLHPDVVNKATNARQLKNTASRLENQSSRVKNASPINDTLNDTPPANAGDARARGKGGSKGRSPKRYDDKPEVPMPDEFKELTDDLKTIAAKVLGEWSQVIDVRVEHVAWVARAERDGVLQKDWRAAWRSWLTLAIKRAKESGATPPSQNDASAGGEDTDTVEARVRRRAASQPTGDQKR